MVAGGRDPRPPGASTVGAIIEGYLAYGGKRQKPRSFVESTRHLRVNCASLSGASALKLTRRDVATHLAAIEAEKGPVTAARVRTALSAAFNWAIREGYEIPANPVSGTNRPVEPPSRARVLGDAELAQLWRALPESAFGDIIQLLILTGQRREEIGGLRWDEVDLARATLTFGPERTKNRRVHELPLSPAALAILARQPRLGLWVFGPGGQRH